MNVEHERALRVRALLPNAPVEIPWRTHGLLLRLVFFGLTLAGLAAFHFLFDETGLLTAVVAIALAEYLIRKRRWWWTGVEEALWLGAPFAAISELPSSGTPESNLVLAAAAAVAGARVRNPVFGALAMIFVVAWFEQRLDLGVLAALLFALGAALALLRNWRRPSTEWLFIAFVIVLPVVGRFYADEKWRLVTILLYCAYGAVVLLLAILKKHHALFFSAGLAIAIALGDIGERLAAPLELKLSLAGALLLGGSWLVARALRDRTRGIIATPAKLTEYDDELEIAATAALPRAQFDQRMESGGEFGGAGATGKY